MPSNEEVLGQLPDAPASAHIDSTDESYTDPSIPCAHEGDKAWICNYCGNPCEHEPTYCFHCKEYKLVPVYTCLDCGEPLSEEL